MSERPSTYQRILRRETHSPRSTAAIVVAVILILLCAWLATEAVLRLLGRPALLASPADAARATIGATSVPQQFLIGVGIVAVIVGLVLIIVSLAPGRRAKHFFTTERSAVVVDNEVIASSVARRAAHAGNVSPDNASVSVTHHRANVTLRPSSGFPVDEVSVRKAAENELARIDAQPRLTSNVMVESTGKVGT